MTEPAVTTAPPAPTRRPPAPEPDPAVERAPGAEAAGNAAMFGLLDDSGDFVVDLGPAPGFRIPAALLRERRIDLAERGRVLPGLVFESATFAPADRTRMLRIAGHFEIPHVESSAFTVNVSRAGRASLQATANTQLPALGNPRLSISIGEDKTLTASATIDAADLTPASLRRKLTVTGGGTITLSAGKLSGSVNATLDYPRLGSGAFDLAFSETGSLSGSGHVALNSPFLGGVRAELAVTEAGSLSGTVEIPAARIAPSVAGLQIGGGTVRLAYADGVTSGALDALILSYPGLGSATINATITRGQFEGSGDFALALTGFTDVTGSWAYREGALTGQVTINSRDFPEGLPIQSGTITATLGATGAVSFAGSVRVMLGPAGNGELRAGYNEAGQVSIGATVNLTVPGLQGATFTINYVEGQLSGSADVPIDPSLLPGITGAVRVEFREGLWAGETELSYSADDGKLSGTIRVRVAQTEEGALQVTGSGDVTAQIAPRLQGTLHAEILPEGGVDVSGSITVTEPLELFPELRTDRELFRYSQNIPLWAILVAVIRIRAGIRAGIGPGVFRNITVEGSYTIGQDGEPSFSISGELFIPAFAEAYVAFGAGLGLDVVLGSLTGGIEGVASAGIYGAVSVIPVLSYTDGNYMIEGTATLAAGARFKVGLNAWAEVEAFWVTVWENTWQLGEWMWNIGPDLGLQAHMAYNFSNPAPPTIEFNTSDIDTGSLIQAAMPEDGPAPSGAREALQNRAEWQGQLRQPGPAAGTVPPELAAQANTSDAPPPAPPRPPAPVGPPPGTQPAPGVAPVASPSAAAAAGGPPGARPTPTPDAAADAAGPAPGRAPTPGSADAAAVAAAGTPPATPERAAPADQVPQTNQPRFPQAISLAMLDESPVPMPRTPEQQEEDVEAANTMVGLIENSVTDTAELESYFPRIKRRFQLSAIALEPQPGGGVCVKIEVNPVRYNRVEELLRGDDLARTDGLALRTEVEFKSDTLGGSAVGTEMEARLLGPDHPAGGPPQGQDALMGKLPSRTGDEATNYIRGHLLNDNIGGPGREHNLFPITQQANRLHESHIESRIKRWVNTDRYWCYYKVVIANERDNLANEHGPYYVSADIITTAAVLKVGGRRDTQLASNGVSARSHATIVADDPLPSAATANVTINSTSRGGGSTVPVNAINEAGLAGHEALPADDAREVALSTRNRDRTDALDPELAASVLSAIGRGSEATVKAKAMEVPGVGDGMANVLIAAAKNPASVPNMDPNTLGLVTRLNDPALARVLLGKIRRIWATGG
ncbi:hypothetical protein ACMGDH_01650 [Sphingomonas sp. DT-207]|uniref:hypothetical protein n=1 Tax=Sphingomonas sp. DT-207 TaxID=3396167 RepID=UPI003F1D7A8F